MPIFTITSEDRYQVEADSLEQATASFRVWFDEVEPELFEIESKDLIDQDLFEYLDGKVEVREKNY
jgi:hypothetical protein